MKEENVIQTQRYHSPCGELVLGSLGGKLCLCNWTEEKHPGRVERRLRRLLAAEFEESPSEVVGEAAKQLDEYFRGGRRGFTVPLLFAGTDFQQKVWRLLQEIPYGSTLTYAGLAAGLGMPGAVRAVANANGANALSLFVPCHRVIGADGSLTGYAGGTDAKKISPGPGARLWRSALFQLFHIAVDEPHLRWNGNSRQTVGRGSTADGIPADKSAFPFFSAFYGEPLNTSPGGHRVKGSIYVFDLFGRKQDVCRPMFSFSRHSLRVPGMGTIHGFLHIIQAREICAGVACFCSASLSRRENSALFCPKLSFWNWGMEAR